MAGWTVDLELEVALTSVEKDAFNKHGEGEYTIILFCIKIY
jgi:hypothetical protein